MADIGAQLQQWSIRWGWPILWVPCDASTRMNTCKGGYNVAEALRLLDPCVLDGIAAGNSSTRGGLRLDIPHSPAFTTRFRKLWQRAANESSDAGRQAVAYHAWDNLTILGTPPPPPPPPASSLVRHIRNRRGVDADHVSTSLVVRPLSARDCPHPDLCIGVEVLRWRNVSGDLRKRVGSCVCYDVTL